MARSIPIVLILLMLGLVVGVPLLMRPPEAAVRTFDERLVIVTPHWEGIKEEYGSAFASWYQEQFGKTIAVDWLDQGGASNIVKFLRSEYARSPDTVDIDIFWGGGTDPYVELARLGYLEPYKLPGHLLEGIPREYSGIPVYAPDYSWYGTALSGFGIIYNKVVNERMGLPTPATWSDLDNPELFSWVGSGDPSQSGSAHMMYEIMIQAYGWREAFAVITGIGANARYFSKGTSDVPRDVSLGEVACGLCIDFYAGVEISAAGPDRVGFVLPEGLTVINPDSIGILKGAPNRQAAQRFLEFVMSPEGQRLWMLPRGSPGGPKRFELRRLPVLPALYGALAQSGAGVLDPFKWRSSFRYDPEKGSARWAILNALLQAAIIGPHAELARAWRAVHAPGADPALREALLDFPVSEEEIMSLAQGEWNDAERRSQIRAGWSAMFQERYLKILEKAGERGRVAVARSPA